MPIDGAQIDTIARHVHEGYERKARRDHDWNNGMAVADAVARAIGEALADLSGRLDPGETLVDLAHAERYTVGLRGVQVTLTVLAATSRRMWHLAHRDGAVAASVPIPMDAVRAQKKGLAPSINVERSGGGWTVTGTKPVVTWMEGIVRDRPQAPVGLVAKLAPPSTAPPPSWAPDPAGRHELRYWDGTLWTEHVSDRGTMSQDPLD